MNNKKYIIDKAGTLRINSKAKFDTIEYIPEKINNISVIKIADSAFENRLDINTLILPSTIISIGDKAFANCFNLKRIELPKLLKSIGSYTFFNDASLQTLSIPSTVCSIKENCFQNCKGLFEITTPEGVECLAPYLYDNCILAQKITVSNGTKKINPYVFSNCKNVKKIFLPETLEKFTLESIKGCSSLSYIYFNGTQEQWNKISGNLVYSNIGIIFIKDIIKAIDLIEVGKNSEYSKLLSSMNTYNKTILRDTFRSKMLKSYDVDKKLLYIAAEKDIEYSSYFENHSTNEVDEIFNYSCDKLFSDN